MAEGQIKIMDAAPFFGILAISAAAFLVPALVDPAKTKLGRSELHTNQASITKNEPSRKQDDGKKKQPLLPKTEAVMFNHQARTGMAMRLMARGRNGKPPARNFSPQKQLTHRMTYK